VPEFPAQGNGSGAVYREFPSQGDRSGAVYREFPAQGNSSANAKTNAKVIGEHIEEAGEGVLEFMSSALGKAGDRIPTFAPLGHVAVVVDRSSNCICNQDPS
jgi:hypothetical protein